MIKLRNWLAQPWESEKVGFQCERRRMRETVEEEEEDDDEEAI